MTELGMQRLAIGVSGWHKVRNDYIRRGLRIREIEQKIEEQRLNPMRCCWACDKMVKGQREVD